MSLILYLFRGFDIEYNKNLKVLSINKPISVKNFTYLRKLLKLTNEEIRDIRVYGDNYSRLRGKK